MKKQPLLLVGFSKYTDQGLLVKTNLIISNMTDNTLYSDAGAKLTAVGDALEAFSGALGKKGTVLNYLSLKGEKRATLTDALKTLGYYVRDKYPGNVANWLTTGFDVQTFDTPTQVPDTPTDLIPVDGTQEGEVRLKFKAMKYAVSYDGRCWKKGDNPPANAMVNTTSSRNMLFTGLEPLTDYIFQVRSRGRKGVSMWGQTVQFAVR